MAHVFPGTFICVISFNEIVIIVLILQIRKLNEGLVWI